MTQEIQRVRTYSDEEGAKVVLRTIGDKGEVFVKVYCVEMRRPFGTRQFLFTGSHCDASGSAIRVDGAPKVHEASHELEVKSDAPSDLAARVSESLSLIARRVRSAVLNETSSPLELIG